MIVRYLAFLIMFLGASTSVYAESACGFDKQKLAFTGTDIRQAKCLLRTVNKYAKLSENLDSIPEPLSSVLGQKVTITQSKFSEFLQMSKISEKDVGGSMQSPLATAKNGTSEIQASYFVIHDTSTPNYKTQDIPSDINDASWKHNDLSRWMQGSKSKAHIFINRLGQSVSPVDYSQPWRATKFELNYGNLDPKGLFVHIELVQPRKSDTKGTVNDAIAPLPGFTDAQYERLALVYTAASIRRGAWLTPVFHAVLDKGYKSGHDDPQNFELIKFAQALDKIINQLN